MTPDKNLHPDHLAEVRLEIRNAPLIMLLLVMR
jgi:hypothetical protein